MKRTFLALILFALSACEATQRSSIPDYPVYLELDLTFEDRDLIPIQASKIYTQRNINQAVEQTGYGGVLIYHGINSVGGSAYYAFDAACPNEASSAVTVAVDKDQVYAVCPQCHSQYELLNGIGNPVSGPSKERLKPYNVFQSGQIIYIRN